MVDVLPQSRNVIPDQVVVALDWRVLPEDETESLVARVREAVKSRIPVVPEGLGVAVRVATEHQATYTGLAEDKNLFTPGFLMDPAHPVVLAAAEAVGRRGNPSEAATVRPWTFATDGGWSQGVFDIPTVGFAPGEERYAHTNRERLDVEEARWAFERHAHLIPAIQSPGS
jgi:acetylornithine deacetylase/succinyl-diaminopimelate desuccinylase-like protein